MNDPTIPCLLALFLLAVPAGAQVTELIDVASDGAASQATATGATVSADGRFVCFTATDSKLVPKDSNRHTDVFVHDRWTGQTERISRGLGGAEPNNDSHLAVISGDGNVVAFRSHASNLVPGDRNGDWDFFVFDRRRQHTELVSVSSKGVQQDNGSVAGWPALSYDGKLVAFVSRARNLVSVKPTPQGWSDLYLRNRTTGVTALVKAPTPKFASDSRACFSRDGTLLFFSSSANNIVPGDKTDWDVFVKNLKTGKISLLSVNSKAEQSNGSSMLHGCSPSGRYVQFSSTATNLVAGDNNKVRDVFVRDLVLATTIRVNVDSAGRENSRRARFAVNDGAVTDEAAYFQTLSDKLVPNDTNRRMDVFRHDLKTRKTTRISVASDGSQADDHSRMAPMNSVSAGGGVVAFCSDARNLSRYDWKSLASVFARNLRPAPAGVRLVGAASGSCRPLPALAALNAPRQGNLQFVIAGYHARPAGAPGLLALTGGTLAAAFPFYNISIWVDPAAFLILTPIAADRSGVTRFPIPLLSGTKGVRLAAQFLWVEAPSCPGPLRSTRAADIVVQ